MCFRCFQATFDKPFSQSSRAISLFPEERELHVNALELSQILTDIILENSPEKIRALIG